MKWICLALKLLKSQLSIEDKEVTRVYRILTEKMKTMLDKNVSWGKEKWKVVSDKTMIINSTQERRHRCFDEFFWPILSK